MSQDRVERYDSLNGLFHAPTEYRYEPIKSATVVMPDTATTGEYFLEFVRGEFGSGTGRGDCPEEFEFESAELIPFRILTKYVERCETELVFSGLATGLRRSKGADMVAQIHELLANPLTGNKENKRIDAARIFQPLITQQKRIFFIVPGFPFKDQNPFRTSVPASHVDFAEIALLARLHVLTIAIYQVHPFGVDWVIVSDGHSYAPILRIDDAEVSEYQRQLRMYRDFLNIYGSVALLDLRQLCSHLGTVNGESIFDRSTRIIGEQIRDLTRIPGEIQTAFRVLMRGIKWNMNFKDILAAKPPTWQDLWTLLNSEVEFPRPGNYPAHLREVGRVLDELAAHAATQYAASNICIRLYDLYRTFFPSSVRATVHPKPSQIALPSLGSVAPWNGVGIMRSDELSASSLSVEPLYRVSAGVKLRPRKLSNVQHPIGYELIKRQPAANQAH